MNNEVEITNDGLDYTTVEEFTAWISSNKAGLASNDVPNKNSPENMVIRDSLMFAESEVESYVSEHYSLPITGTRKSLYYIKKLCYSIAKYQLFGRRGITKESYFEYTSNKKDLERIASGDLKIPGASLKDASSSIKMRAENVAHFSEAEKEGFSI